MKQTVDIYLENVTVCLGGAQATPVRYIVRNYLDADGVKHQLVSDHTCCSTGYSLYRVFPRTEAGFLAPIPIGGRETWGPGLSLREAEKLICAEIGARLVGPNPYIDPAIAKLVELGLAQWQKRMN